MKPITAPSIFESFNARALEPAEVARTFVPPSQYGTLLKRTHSVVIGPRGSGKTTLLKMLQPAALEAWLHPQADEYRSRIDFTGVFIPTDVSWSLQLEALGDGKLSQDEAQKFALAALNTHILRALVEAMQYRSHPPSLPTAIVHRRVSMPAEVEKILVQQVAAHLGLGPTVPSLLGLKHALTARLSKIWDSANEAAEKDVESRKRRMSTMPFLNQDFLSSGILLIELFNDAVQEGRARWAFLFDELELAPQWMRQQLIRYIRSVDDRLLFKLSVSPYAEEFRLSEDSTSPMAGHDYEPIHLWYAHKEDGYKFCSALLRVLLQQKEPVTKVQAVKIFGRSEFETAPEEWATFGNAYYPGSRLQKRFARLAATDRSFRRYLEQRKIHPSQLHLLGKDERAESVRKITSLVAVREAYRASDVQSEIPAAFDPDESRKRGRKNPTLYRGATSLFAMVEGNPRWFIGIVGGLLERYFTKNQIDAAEQATEVAKATSRFRALLKTIPAPDLNDGRKPRPVIEVLDVIGKYIFHAVVRDRFNPDPPGTFVIDDNATSALVEGLGKALNAGAIVYIPAGDSDLVLNLNTLRGKRFRLSYLLAPYYGIPLRLGRPLPLSTILDKASAAGQKNLFAV